MNEILLSDFFGRLNFMSIDVIKKPLVLAMSIGVAGQHAIKVFITGGNCDITFTDAYSNSSRTARIWPEWFHVHQVLLKRSIVSQGVRLSISRKVT